MRIEEIREDFIVKRIDRLIKRFEERGISSYFAKDRDDAVRYVLENIPDESTIGFGGSVTVSEIGLRDALLNGNYRVYDQYEKDISKEESNSRRRAGITADFFVAGTNAITEDGTLINIDGMGNRLAGIAHGGKKVYIVIGTNKLVANIEDGIWRTMNITAPMNVKRLNIKDPPCYEDGFCSDCTSEGRICNQIHILERCNPPGRITVIILNEYLGF